MQDIKIFNKSGVQILFSEDSITRIAGKYALIGEVCFPTRTSVMDKAKICRKTTWVFSSGVQVMFGLGDLLDELLALEVIDYERFRELEMKTIVPFTRKHSDEIIRMVLDAGVWIRKLKTVGKELRVEECLDFDPKKDGFVWMDPYVVKRDYKGKNKSEQVEDEVKKVVEEINRVENESCAFFSIYAAPVRKISARAYEVKGEFHQVATNIGEDEDLESIMNAVTEEDIRKARIIS